MTSISAISTAFSSDNTMLAAAISYAARNWPVFPLSPRSKSPLPGSAGFKDATTDCNRVHSIWSESPELNVGVAPSGRLLIVDIDPRNGGEAGFRELEKRMGPLPRTLTVETPGGGRHYYFAVPPTADLTLRKKHPDFPGVDFLFRGCYVVAPPSVHPNGGAYSWRIDHSPAECQMAEAPDHLIAALSAHAAEAEEMPITASGNERRAELDPILVGCEFLWHFRDDAASLTEPEWRAGLSIVGRCKGGAEKAHEMSKPYASYNQAETAEKLEKVLKFRPTTCAHIEWDLGFAGCLTCVFKAADMRSPIALGYQKPELVNLQTRYVYDLETQRFRSLRSETAMPAKAFSDRLRHSSSFRKPLADIRFFNSKTGPKVDRVDYYPGERVLIVELPDGRRVLNSWLDTGVIAEAGDCGIILAHLRYLIPENLERDYLLDVLAHLVQKPGEKAGPFLLIIGGQGIGKSLLYHLVTRLVGSSNARKIESGELTGRFRAAMGNVQVLCIEELMHSGRLETYDSLKEWITGETVRAEEKFLPNREVRTPRLLMGFSNHEVPIYLSEDDRRFFVYRSNAEKLDGPYYERLFSIGMQQAAAFKQFLLDRDISAYSPHKQPPVTEAKKATVGRSKTPLAQELALFIQEAERPYDVDLMTVAKVSATLMHGVRSPRTHEVQQALKDVGALNLGQVRVGERRLRLWAIRNHTHWGDVSHDDIRNYMGPYPL